MFTVLIKKKIVSTFENIFQHLCLRKWNIWWVNAWKLAHMLKFFRIWESSWEASASWVLSCHVHEGRKLGTLRKWAADFRRTRSCKSKGQHAGHSLPVSGSCPPSHRCLYCAMCYLGAERDFASQPVSLYVYLESLCKVLLSHSCFPVHRAPLHTDSHVTHMACG